MSRSWELAALRSETPRVAGKNSTNALAIITSTIVPSAKPAVTTVTKIIASPITASRPLPQRNNE